MWESFSLTDGGGPATNPAKMAYTAIPDMLSAAGQLCRAADDLRSAGFQELADNVDRLLEILDAAICAMEASQA